MANVDNPNGLTPVDWNGGCKYARRYYVGTGASAMAAGDLMEAINDGTVARAGAGSDTIVGVAAWFEWKDAYYIKRWGTYLDPAVGMTDIYAFLYDDLMLRYRCQSDDGVASQQTHFFNNIDHLDTAPTQTGEYSGRSNHELDISSLTADSASLRIEARWPVSNNAFGSVVADNQYGEYIVRISEHFRAPTKVIAGPLQQLVPLPGV